MNFVKRLLLLNKITIIIVLILLSLNLLGQNVVIKHFGVNEGLPSSETYYVIKDSKGYLWIASDAGVVKYDGYKFAVYTSKNGLPDNTVFKIHEDNKGRIWFSSYSGKFSYYDYNKDSIFEISANKKLVESIKTLPLEFYFDERDTLFASIDKRGYIKVAPPNYEKFEHIQFPFDCVFIKHIAGDIYLSGKNFKGEIPNRKQIPILILGQSNTRNIDTSNYTGEFGSFVSTVTLNSHTFLSTHKSLYELENNKLKKLNDSESLKNISEINSISAGQKYIWVNTFNKGTFVINKNSLSKLYLNVLNNYTVTCVMDDQEDGVWISTLEDGLFHIPDVNFKYLDSKAGFKTDKLLSIVENNNKIVCLLSDYHIQDYNFSTEEIRTIESGSMANWGISKINNRIIVYSSPSFIMDTLYRNPIEISYNNNNVKSYIKIKDTDKLDESNFIACAGGGLYKVNIFNGEAELLASGLPNIFSVCNTPRGIYIGTKNGAYLYDKNGTRYLGDDNLLLKSRIEDILTVNDNVALATRGNGILILKPNGKLIQIDESNGLASDIVRCLTVDLNKNIWAGTNRGITKLSYLGNDRYKVLVFNLSNGLISSEINRIVIVDDKMFFATSKGLGKVLLKEVNYGKSKIPVYIEAVKVNNLSADISKLMELEHNQNMLQINYKGLRVINNGDILYKFRLLGLDSNWIYTHNTNVQFTTLPPGNYQFEVYAINSENIEGNMPAILKFTILKPFWATWWFLLLVSILVFTLLYVLYIIRIKQIKVKARATQSLIESELKALRSQMNPHFIFNAINSIQHFVLKNEGRIAQTYLTKFARLIRLVLENSKHNFITLTNEIESLKLYIELEALRSSFSFDFEINADENLNSDVSLIPPMLIQPYIENAILHGLNPLTDKQGKLKVEFKKQGNKNMLCVIEDNGIGREKALEIKRKKDLNRKSMGMEVTGERIDLLNKHAGVSANVKIIDLYKDSVSQGTRVEILIELK